MNRLFRTLTICVAVLIVGACSVELGTTPSSEPTSSTLASPTVTNAPSLSPSVPAVPTPDLSFPPTRRLPIGNPAESTPEAAIDAFLRLVRDPALSYHLDGVGRWTVDDVELRTATSVDLAGVDRHFVTSQGSDEVEVIVRGEYAVGRLGTGAWQSIDFGLSRGLYSLASTIVIGDLGPDQETGGYRLVIEAGFELFPREVAMSSGQISSITEVVIDIDGRPLEISYRRSVIAATVGQKGLSEGIVKYTVERFGEVLTIPDLPGSATGSDTQPAPPVTPQFSQIEVPGGVYSIDMPGTPQAETREMTFGRSGIDARYLVVAVGNVRFEVGEAQIAPDIVAGMSASDQLKAARYATTSRISNGNVLGWRPVELVGFPAQEAIVDGADGTHRIRNVLVDGHLITLSVVGPSEDLGSAVVDRFLASLATR